MVPHIPTLRELEAQFIRLTDARGSHEVVERLSQAQGIRFLCPKCFAAKGYSKYGVHSVICWFANRGVPDDVEPRPGRWHPTGRLVVDGMRKYYAESIDDLSFTGPGSFSVELTAGCRWHGLIKDGRATTVPG